MDTGHGTLGEIEALGGTLARVRTEVGRSIVGQDAVVDQALTTLLAGGHALLVGVPGLGKSRLVETLATVLGLHTKRVQFTPDLMPADILGSEVLDETAQGRAFRFLPGPVFCQLLMADEINRASPRTQSALLQAMAEARVAVAGTDHALPKPFHVLATENPIEQEGTYPLPEAQLDRFMFMINVGYPSEQEEFDIVQRTTAMHHVELQHVLSGEEILSLQETVRSVPVADHVIRYALQLSRLTRREQAGCPKFITDYVSWGAGPRASQYLILAGKARALLKGRHHVSIDDIRSVAMPVLRHRIVTNFNAEAEGIKSDAIVQKLLDHVPVQDHEPVDKSVQSTMTTA